MNPLMIALFTILGQALQSEEYSFTRHMGEFRENLLDRREFTINSLHLILILLALVIYKPQRQSRI